jgi:YEATS domain-containing protein 4
VIDDVAPGTPFEVHETGWGEFEITIKLYYVPESLEKPQTIYHHLRLHPYGDTEDEKEKMRLDPEIRAWTYEEQLFNEPYENFYELLTTPMERVKGGGGGGKGTRVMKGGMVGSTGERTTQIPLTNRPGHPFSRETEKLEIQKLEKANIEVKRLTEELLKELSDKNQELADLKKALGKT